MTSVRLLVALAGVALFALAGGFAARIAESDSVSGEYSLDLTIAPESANGSSTFSVTAGVRHGFSPTDCSVPDPGCYQAAQWFIEYDQTIVDLGSNGVPGNATNAVSRVPAAPLQCVSRADNGSRILLGCLHFDGPNITYSGDVWNVNFFCIATGRADFTLVDLNTDSYVSAGATRQPAHLHSDSIECIDGQPVPTAKPRTYPTPGPSLKMKVEFSRNLETIRCDGDSFTVTVTVTYTDGRPAVGALVYVSTSGPDYDGVTNKRGVYRTQVTPPLDYGGAREWIAIRAEYRTSEPDWGPGAFSCPFNEGDYGLGAHVFLDDDADGVQDPRERSLRRNDVRLSFSGGSQAGSLPGRRFRLDRSGNYEWSLDLAGDLRNGRVRGWVVCVSPGEDPEFQIVSASGGEFSQGDDCLRLPVLQPGDNDFNIGVQRGSDPVDMIALP